MLHGAHHLLVVLLEPQVLLDPMDDAQHLGELLLLVKGDLRLDLVADGAQPLLPVLRDEHERREEDRLQRHDHGEQAEREWIERSEDGDELQVPDHPREKPHGVEIDERHAAAEAGEEVGHPLARLLAPLRLVLDGLQTFHAPPKSPIRQRTWRRTPGAVALPGTRLTRAPVQPCPRLGNSGISWDLMAVNQSERLRRPLAATHALVLD